MSDTETVRIRTESRMNAMSTSICAAESFDLLNAGARSVWRGQGDTWTAARDRAAKEAGVTPSQAERLQKNWRTMKFPNGDVYRALLIKYGHLLPTYDRLCSYIENKADVIDREAQGIEEANEAQRSHRALVASAHAPTQGEERELS